MLKHFKLLLPIAMLFFSLNGFAQNAKPLFTKQWIKIDSLVDKGLTKSALAEVNKIYDAAKKQDNEVQVIKSLLYQMNLNQNIQEDALSKNIVAAEKEITVARQPAKSMLQSISAQMYWNYFQQNRWKFYNRTNTENFNKADINTWTLKDFHKKIGELYLSSLKEEKLLQQTKLDQYDPLIIKGNVRYLRPSLYDLLAHEALQYFKSDETDINRPAYAFEIKDDKAFAPAEAFATHSFFNKDSSSLHYKALLIFQKLIAFHLPDSKPDALLDADINRIEFVHQYGAMLNKDELYLEALQNIYTKYSASPIAAQAGFLAAQQIFNKANEENRSTDSLSKFTIAQAKKIAEDIAKKFPGSEGGINAKNLLTQILHKEINLTSEKVNVPGKPFRTLVSYKNISSINCRIIELTPEFKSLMESNKDDNKLWQKLIAQKFIRSWKQSLPDPGDYKNHSAEIKTDALPIGQYALLASVSEDFILDKNPLAVQYLHVSNISFINNGFEYFVLHRESGKPLAGAKVQVYDQQYDYKTSKTIFNKQELITADKNGFFAIEEKKKDAKGKIQSDNRNVRLAIMYENDKLFLDDYQNSYRYYDNDGAADYDANDAEDVKDYEAEKAKIFLFTDRSIYRPGQLVYFKGIAITKDLKTRQSKLLLNKDSILATLSDANSDNIDSLKLVVNEYGSIHGTFRLPENKMNGQFEITAEDFDNSSISFSVEEYKRPKFFAEFEKAKGTYKVKDTITISGFAKAYAGNNIDGATVKYRVKRIARFLYPWMFWRMPMPQTSSLEITHGEIKTGTDGKFSIAFAAIPDESIDKKTDPVFDYIIEADVTDINGETRSANITVPVSYKALTLHISLPQDDAINVDSLKHIFISSKNISGEFDPAKVELKIYALQTPQRLIRKRYWEQPDKFVMSKEEFLQYFPNDEYTDENKKENWPRGQIIFTKTDSTKPIGNWPLQGDFVQGWYVAEATTKDKYGEEVKDIKYFQLYDMKATSLPAPAYLWNTTIKNVAEPGEKAQLISGTSAKEIFLIQQIDKSFVNGQGAVVNGQKSMGEYAFYSLNNEKKTFDYPVAEQDRGGFGVYQFFVKDNRVYTSTYNINVPWTNKQLDISYTTYRDKTLPGSEEKWTAKISGSKGEKVAAEMLAAMYDASLDQFKPQSWSKPDIWPNNYSQDAWGSALNFTSVQAMIKWINEDYIEQKAKTYDQLMVGNYTYRNGIPMRSLSGRVSGIEVQQSMNAPNAKDNLQDVVVVGYGTKKKDLTGSETSITIRGISSLNLNNKELLIVDGVPFTGLMSDLNPDDLFSLQVLKSIEATSLYGEKAANGVIIITTKKAAKEKEDLSSIKARKNFNETAFFFPDLKTDKEGNVEFGFTMPEALTKWKLMTLAHTKDLAFGYTERTLVTQKELMVQPNAPRFFREGDTMQVSAKIVNLGAKEISGKAQLQLLNASTMNPVDTWFKNDAPLQAFTAAAGQSTVVKFRVIIPKNFNDAVVYRIVAKSSNFLSSGGGRGEVSDGEEAAIPVLTNRMLVTETMPLSLKNNETKNFSFQKLLLSGDSKTMVNHALTVEYTTNPAWFAVQALPYLMEYPYECAEQTFNRYYANSLASKIVNASPKIKAVFQKWKASSPSERAGGEVAALLSNLQKNEELKSVLLQETPWVWEAKNESEQKKNIALLFDMVRMSKEMESSLTKLQDMQSPNGGFVWFKGGPDDRYITQYILTGIGHLKKLNAINDKDKTLTAIINAALPYLDKKIKQDYDNLMRNKKNRKTLAGTYIGDPLSVQYLYMRSFFKDHPVAKEYQAAYNYSLGEAKKNWLKQSKFSQAMIALSLYRNGDKTAAQSIIRSLKENAITNEELGMYWKEFDRGGYWWYQAPIESQAMMIEAFGEIGNDTLAVNDLKTWLLKNKQTNNWHTTKATAEACYALLLQGTDWLSEEKNVVIKLGNTIFNSNDEKQEAGTGYFKRKIDGDKISPDMGNISIKVSNLKEAQKVSPNGGDLEGASWGAIYWQYFEDLNKITFAETPLKLNKKLFVERNTDNGPVLSPLATTNAMGSEVKIGDKIKVRIELRVDRDMEYVHMKDMRGACMEPANVLSEYKYQDGLGYYETTKDASTNFFFNYLPKGTYVFEYSMFVSQAGNFSNGVTTIQCMYALEFTAHSEGVRVNVE